jgi:hypothetical protein
VRSKPQVLSDFTSGDLKFQSITTDEVQVRVYEKTAVETGLSTMVGQDKDKAVPRGTRCTRVWVKQQGRWRLVANHFITGYPVNFQCSGFFFSESVYEVNMCAASRTSWGSSASLTKSASR